MGSKRRGARELWILGGLLLLFVLFVPYLIQAGQESAPADMPSAVNSQKKGVKGCFLWLEQEGFPVEKMKNTWDFLDSHARLLIVIEPFERTRPVSLAEIAALEKWVKQGGTLLYLPADPNGLHAEDTVTGDVAVESAPEISEEIAPLAGADSPFLNHVEKIAVSTPVRLKPAPKSGYATLLQDKEGALILTKRLGKGQVLIVANRKAASNAGIQEADNAILLYNIVAQTAGFAHSTLFDEYHHGIGFQQTASNGNESLAANIPLPIWLAGWQGLGLFLLLLYNGNRRFGPPRMAAPIQTRPSTDYIGSMANLLRRAGAADIAFETLYLHFVRDMTRHLDAPPNAPAGLLAELAFRRYGSRMEGLAQILAHGEQVVAGQRITENEMLLFARQIEHFRRVCSLVGN